jgi:hypothetical protein
MKKLFTILILSGAAFSQNGTFCFTAVDTDVQKVTVCSNTYGDSQTYNKITLTAGGSSSTEEIRRMEFLNLLNEHRNKLKAAIAEQEAKLAAKNAAAVASEAAIAEQEGKVAALKAAIAEQQAKLAAKNAAAVAAPVAAPATAPPIPTTAAPPAEGAKTVSLVQPQTKESKSLTNAANRIKQRKACLELAKDNPSIMCK